MHAAPPHPGDDGDLALLIRRLSDADAETRTWAAAEIFRRGCEMVQPATAPWFQDSGLATCFLLHTSGAPRATVGIAVNLSNFDRIRSANGSPLLANVPDDQDLEEFELEFPDGVMLDLLTAKHAGSGGAIKRFLQRFGEGIQQVELQVSDVDRATDILRARFSTVPIYPQTRAGADGTRVNFFLVAGEQGKKVLIELVEATEQPRV